MTTALSVGARWRHLRILAPLGAGGYGKVYQAWDESLSREVALKLIPASDEATATAIIEEGRRLARVNHPNIATVFGADRHGDSVGIWMDCINGRTLARIVEDHGPFNSVEAAAMGRDVCRALAAVHGAGLVHRDITAANVMRERGGRIVLIDFGASTERLSRFGVTAGTRRYLAPETLSGEPASVKSDVYATGVLLFHIATGTYPDQPDDDADVTRGRQARLLSDVRPDLPLAFCEVVERAIAHDPSERFQTIGALELALANVGTGESAPASKPKPVPAQYRRRRWWLAAAAVAAVSIAAVQLAARPTFTLGGNQRVPMNTEPQGVDGWATGFRDESSAVPDDRFVFTVTNDRPKLFIVEPMIFPSGRLNYQVATNAVGTATVTVKLTDRRRPFGFNATSAPQTFDITVVAPPHPPTAVDDQFQMTTDTTLNVGVKALPHGLTNWWRADGDVRDAVTGAVGRAAGAGFTAGRSGSAFLFDGVDDVISLGRMPGNFGTGDFTVSVLVQTRAQRSEAILSKRFSCGEFGSSWGMLLAFPLSGHRGGHVGNDFRGAKQLSVDYLYGVRQINDGSFHAIVVSRMGPVYMLYVDGVYDFSTVSAMQWPLSNSDELRLGIDGCVDRAEETMRLEGRPIMSFHTHRFTGAIDEIAFFDRALTVDEIRNLHHHGVLANDNNALGDLMSAVLVSGTSRGDLQLHEDGTFVYQPHRGFRGIDTYTYRARNAFGELSGVATVSITVK